MHAIIAISQAPSGEEIQLLSMGNTEFEARKAAYATLHHGHNDFDFVYPGGIALPVSEPLAALYRAAGREHVLLDDQGRRAGSTVTDAYFEYQACLSRLCIRNGELSVREREPEILMGNPPTLNGPRP